MTVRSGRKAAQPVLPGSRLLGVALGILFVFGGVVYKLAQIQAVNPEPHLARSISQRVREHKLPADRGSILDRNGFGLAVSVDKQTVWADPLLIPDPAETARTLAPVLAKDEAELEKQLTADSRFTYLSRLVTDTVAEQIDELDLPGVYLLEESTRLRPADDLAVATVGRTTTDNIGRSGMELQYDDLLVGTPGSLLFERSRTGKTISTGDYQAIPPVRGHDVMLTIDHRLQYLAEEVLAEHLLDARAKQGMVIVAEPASGEVLAMASLRVEDGVAVNTGQNLALTHTYEPGSVMKIVPISAAVEEDGVGPLTELHLPHCLTIHSKKFCDPGWGAHDRNLSWIMAHSSNVGTIMLARQLGSVGLEHYLERFGFGEKTGVGFPQEDAGVVHPRDEWSGTSLPTYAIGHGMLVTGMQVIDAYNTIANGGVRIPPTLVKQTIAPDGAVTPAPLAPAVQVVSEATAGKLTDMMVEVVADGTGVAAAVPNYLVAGKTGTAWKVLDNGTYTRGLDEHDYTTTFVGFAPANDPQISIFVMLDEPENTDRQGGGTAAAPVFADIATQALLTLDVPPDETVGYREPGEPVRGVPAYPAGSEPLELAEGDGADG